VGVVVTSDGGRGYVLWWEREEDSPATQMRELLAGYRREGLSFFQAWAFALARIRWTSRRGQHEWLRAWEDDAILMAWLQAYERSPGAFPLDPDDVQLLGYPEAASQELPGPQHYTAPYRLHPGEAA